MKILVTGGAGFIGSHVVDAYVAVGHRVTVVDDLSSGRRANLNSRARFVRADINENRLQAVFSQGKFDLVNHHAAQIDVRLSVADPVRDAEVNLLGLLNILELSRRHGVRKIIFAASGGTYFGECRRPAREDDPPDPRSPYGVSKLAGEHYLRAYQAIHHLDFTVLRYGNVYGPRQDPHGEAGVVAIFCRALATGAPVFIYGDGRQQRDYVFVKDVARANLAALRKGSGEAFNIGAGRAESVNALFAALNRLRGGGGRAIRRPARPGELLRSLLNPARAKRGLGWRAEISLAEGLKQTLRHISTGGE